MSSNARLPITVLMPSVKNGAPEKIGQALIKFKPFTLDEKCAWLSTDIHRGFIRIYEPDRNDLQQQHHQQNNQQTQKRSIVVPCTIDTNCRQICERLIIADTELHVTLNGDTVRRLDPLDKPLQIQNNYLQTIGVSDLRRQQECGDSMELGFLVKFTAGRPVINDEFGRPTLSCYCHVRKGRVFHQWTKRLCVLNSARLLVYPDLDRNGTPDVVALSRAKVEDVHLRSRGRCIKITVAAPRRPVNTYYLAFDSAIDLNNWLSRCMKGAAKVPPISDLSNLQLEYLPEQVFCIGSERLLTHLNLRRNCLKERPVNGDSFCIGFLNDLPRLESLRSLNIADNDLRTCPSALFQLTALTELVLSGNKLTELPEGVGNLRNLQTLNIQNNWLSRLPNSLAECQALTNIDLSFNRFASIPEIMTKLRNVEHLAFSGNDIERFADQTVSVKSLDHIRRVELRRCKLIANPFSAPSATSLMNLTHLDIRDNQAVTTLDLRSLHFLQVFLCQRCNLHELQLNGSALSCILASKNDLQNLVVMPVPKNLKVFDVSNNKMTKLPEWLTELSKIEKIVASHNRLVVLPHRIFTSVSSIKVLILHHNAIASLPAQVENCFIEYLDLHHNKLTHLPTEFLASAHKLRILNLSQNLLAGLPALNPFLDLNKVQQLYLACNRLADDAVRVIADYRRLRVLDLSYNLIKNIEDSWVEKLQMLESVNLSGNRLHSLPPSLTSLPNLFVLRAHSNRIVSLPDFSRAVSLKVLDCGSNQLELVDVRHLLSPQLKHLDVSCNPRLRLDTSAFQQFRSERLVSLIDMSRESQATIPTTATSKIDVNTDADHPAWQAGFTETSGERNKLCICQIRRPTFSSGCGPGALFAIIDGGLNNELPQHLAAKLPEILQSERSHSITSNEYMKYTLLRAHQTLRTGGQKMGASCTLCHIDVRQCDKITPGLRERKDDGDSHRQYTLRLANCGHTEAVLCRKGKAVLLTRRFLVDDADFEEIDRIRKASAIVTEENEVNGITHCTRLLGCNFLYPAVTPDPHVTTVDINRFDDEFLLIASRGLWDVMDYSEAVKRIRRIPNPILAAKHLQDVAQGYGYKENLSILVVRFFFNYDADACGTSDAGPVGTNPLVFKTNRRPIMSALNIGERASSPLSLTSDEEVQSEPHDKNIREQPNYYFEYKKQLKQLMLDGASSDGVPESLYSVATIVRDDNAAHSQYFNPPSDGEMEEHGHGPYCFDDGYQSSDIGHHRSVTPKLDYDFSGEDYVPLRLKSPTTLRKDFDTSQKISKTNIIEVNNSQPNMNFLRQPRLLNADGHSSTSTSPSGSSGLGSKSSAISPEQLRLLDDSFEKSNIPKWRIEDDEALQEAKCRFQQARNSIMLKLGGNDSSTKNLMRSRDEKLNTVSKQNLSSDELRPPCAYHRHCCPDCNATGGKIGYIDAAVSTDLSLYETPKTDRDRSKRQAIYHTVGSNENEFNKYFNDFQHPQLPGWASHSDGDIQFSTNHYENSFDDGEEERPPQLPSNPPPALPTHSIPNTVHKRHTTLVITNVEIDNGEAQNVIICDPFN